MKPEEKARQKSHEHNLGSQRATQGRHRQRVPIMYTSTPSIGDWLKRQVVLGGVLK